MNRIAVVTLWEIAARGHAREVPTFWLCSQDILLTAGVVLWAECRQRHSVGFASRIELEDPPAQLIAGSSCGLWMGDLFVLMLSVLSSRSRVPQKS